MSGKPPPAVADRLTQLSQRLREITAGADVRVLSGDQVLVSWNLVPNPAMERGGKAATYSPGNDGYEVHVACRSATEHAEQAALSQRMTGPSTRPVEWDSRTMRLRVAADGMSRDWLLRNESGEIVTVHVAAGSIQVLDEVNSVLAEVEGVLLT
jgi:hypothetical protein